MKIYFINGFLGSGKTTLVKRLLEEYKSKKLAVIINEYGDTEFDELELRKADVTLTVIKSGLLFCVCKLSEFTSVLKSLLTQELDYLLVETSGFADLGALSAVMKAVVAESKRDIEYYNITIVDGINLPKLLDTLMLVTSQLKAADIVIINKSDLLSAQQIKETQTLVERYSAATSMLTTYCEVDAILDRIIVTKKPGNNECAKHRDSTLASLALEVSHECDSQQVIKFLELVKNKVYRAKGIIKLKDGLWNIQLASGQITNEATKLRATNLSLLYSSEETTEAELIAIFKQTTGGL